MKVYVDKLPKSCWDCPCHKGDNGLCKLLQEYTDYVPKTCPLQSLSDYTKQVRKEVCEEIRNKLKQNGLLYTWKGEPKYKTMEELLNQIQGEDTNA